MRHWINPAKKRYFDLNLRRKKNPYENSHPARHWICGLSMVLIGLIAPVTGNLVNSAESSTLTKKRSMFSHFRKFVLYRAPLTISTLTLCFSIFFLSLFSDYSEWAHGDISTSKQSTLWINFVKSTFGNFGNYVNTVISKDIVNVSLNPKRSWKTVFPGMLHQLLIQARWTRELLKTMKEATGLDSNENMQEKWVIPIEEVWKNSDYFGIPMLEWVDAVIFSNAKSWIRLLCFGLGFLLLIQAATSAVSSVTRQGTSRRTFILGTKVPLRVLLACLCSIQVIRYSLLLNRGHHEMSTLDTHTALRNLYKAEIRALMSGSETGKSETQLSEATTSLSKHISVRELGGITLE